MRVLRAEEPVVHVGQVGMFEGKLHNGLSQAPTAVTGIDEDIR